MNRHAIHRYVEPLSPLARYGVMASVLFFHVGAGYALTQIDPPRIVVGDTAPLEVSFVAPDAPAQREIPPPPEDTPLPDVPPPLAEVMVAPPDPDLPPPEFPVEAKPKPPEPPKPKPVPPKVVQPPRPPAPSNEPAQASSAPVQTTHTPGPQTLTAAQVGYLNAPAPIYPMRSKRAGDQGTVMVKVLVDVGGRPAQVQLQKSSGHAELDESALSAVRAARFRPYMQAGVAQPVWVLCPIGFALQ